MRGTGCPYCANRKVLPEETSLAAQYPLLAAQWDPVQNGACTPSQVTGGTHRKVWWRCPQGHSWQASVVSRVQQGTGCPVCSGRKVQAGENDLATRRPALAAEWDPVKNGPLTPQQVTESSNRRVWWRCPKGHSYQASVSHRARNNSGCPYCANRKVLPGFNDLATRFPTLADQWDQTLNGDLTPADVTAGCRRKVWWRCPENHVWKAVVYARTGPQKSGCPVCAGKVRRKLN